MSNKSVCVDCKYFHGYDGVGELWVGCALHGDFKVKAVNCKDFEKKVTKADLLKKIRKLEEENEQLKQSNDRFADTVAKQVSLLIELRKENEQLQQELQGMEELLQSYRKTIKHDAELLADASKKGYLPPLNDYVSTEGWICGCCKHFHSGVRDRCDKDNNWVLKDGSCQDFER